MNKTKYNGSRQDMLLLLDSPRYLDLLNSALTDAETIVSDGDVHRPIGAINDKEYELPEFSREYLQERFDCSQTEDPAWWIVKRTPMVRTPNFDLISTATIRNEFGILLVEAKAHYGELEISGKRLDKKSYLPNHEKIGESIATADRALNAITPGFRLSRDRCYQISNRVAWGWKLASLGVPVTILYLGFTEDPYWISDPFISSDHWMQAARAYLANVVPSEVLHRRIQCSCKGSLLITAAGLPAVPVP
jgi:hypothetical protein